MKTIYEKKRYVSFKILGIEKKEEEEFVLFFKNKLIFYHGIYELSKNRLFIISKNKDRFIVKCNKDFVDKLLGATCFINNFKNKRINIVNLNVSGTLKKLGIKDDRKKGIL